MWGRGGAGVAVLASGWGCATVEGEEKTKREREGEDLPISPRVSLLLCVQDLEDKKNKRER
jgi:hypothetical protein